MVRVSAPAKCHMAGEHSVVYNQPAIITAVGRRVYVNAERSDGVSLYSRQLEGSVSCSTEEAKEFASRITEVHRACLAAGNFSELQSTMKADQYNTLKAAVGKSLEMTGASGGISIEVDSQIPIGSGVGSSSALSVAVSKAIAEAYGISIDRTRNNEMAFEIERLNHGTPSGGDNSACCFGGLIWFVKGTPPTIVSLREEIPYSLPNFALLYTRKPDLTTMQLVQKVRDLDEGYRMPRVEGLGKATHDMRAALKRKDMPEVRRLVNYVHETLAELGVSTSELDRIHTAVKEVGGAAKLCGAGGGGIMLLQHDDEGTLRSLVKELGYEDRFWTADLSVEGVRIEA